MLKIKKDKNKLFYNLIQILKPSKYYKNYFQYCNRYADIILNEIEEEKENYEITGEHTKSGNPVIIDIYE